MTEAVSAQEERRRHAVLLLVQNILDHADDSSATSSQLSPSTPPRPQSYAQLSDGYTLYAILHRVAPDIFVDVEEMTAPVRGDESTGAQPSMSWAVRKANLLTLIRRMNEYTHATLGPARSFDLTQMVHAEAMARSCTLQETISSSSSSSTCIADSTTDTNTNDPSQEDADHVTEKKIDGGDENPSSDASGVRDFAALVDLFVLIVVLSGVPSVMQVVKKSLPREVQVTLSNIAKAVMVRLQLRPLRRYETPARMGSVSRLRESANHATSASASSSVTATPMPRHMESSVTSMSATVLASRGASDALIPAAYDNPHNNNNKDDVSFNSPSTLHTHSSAASLTSAAGVTEPLMADASYYRHATLQLRRELAELHSRAGALESQLRLATQEGQTWEAKYRHLLQSHQGEHVSSIHGAAAGLTTSAASSTPTAAPTSLLLNATSSSSTTSPTTATMTVNTIAGEDVALLRQRLAQRDDTIARLSQRVEEQASRLSEFKEATTAQEAALRLMRRKLKQVEEDVVRQAAARREASDKLAVAEDKLTVSARVRAELESAVEQAQSELRVLQLTQQDRNGGNGGEDTGALLLRNASFASNGSVDRVMQLENELDDVRAARDVAQRQLHILQRQVSIMPAPVADATAAADTWKAQMRLLTAERDELRRAHSDALRRLQRLQNGAHDDAPLDSETTRRMTGRGAGRRWRRRRRRGMRRVRAGAVVRKARIAAVSWM